MNGMKGLPGKSAILIGLLLATFTLVFSASSDGQVTFYAVYDKVFQKEGVTISDAAMSKDGNKLIFSGRDGNTKKPVVFMLNANGSGLTSIPLPEDIRHVGEVAINQDGSRAFFKAEGHLVFKVQGGAATQIHDANEYFIPVAETIGRIKTTADGDYIYYVPWNGNGIWRISQTGGAPEQIIDPARVPLDDGKGIRINNWDISDDGKRMVLCLYASANESRRLIVYDNGNFKQIYKNKGELYERIGISGNGNIIIFDLINTSNYCSADIDGSNMVAFAPRALFNFNGLDLTYDGSKMIYKDDSTHKGRIANTDGSGLLDIFPTSYYIDIGTFGIPSISNDGKRIGFRWGDSLYVGHFNDRQAVPDAPAIESVSFEPKYILPGSARQLINLTAKIYEPYGLSNITGVICTKLIDGRVSQQSEIPIDFSEKLDRKGDISDQNANDGIFACLGKPGGKIGNISRMTVRVSAMDQDGTVVVADAILTTGNGSSPAPVSTMPSLMSPTPEELSKWITLYENAPDAEGTVSSATIQQFGYSPSKLNYSSAESGGDSFSLLKYLQYIPNERNQGSCGNCWQWAGTAVMEIELAFRNGIKDRLSVQYVNSNINWPGEPCCACCGNWLDTFANFYANKKQAIPWTNFNARWMDGSSVCNKTRVSAGSTSTSPAYSIVSIRTEKIPTHAVGAKTAIDNIKNVLRQGKAVWFAYLLPNSKEWNRFNDIWKDKPENTVFQLDIASGSLYNFSEGEGGGHAVVCVGYDDTDPNNSYWIMLNSWGTENGLRPNGLFRVNMDMNYDCQYTSTRNPYLFYGLYFQTLDVIYLNQSSQKAVDPWNDPAARQMIDEWLRQQDSCAKKIYPGAYIDQWGRLCGKTDSSTISCDMSPDHPAGWDNYHWLWYNNWCESTYYTVRGYVAQRQSGKSFDSLSSCKQKGETCID